ncbi:MAG: aconitase family protein [candidate division WOR-3 bacterium]
MNSATFAEKLLARKAGLSRVVAGQIVTVRPDKLLMHDNAAAIVTKVKTDIEQFGLCNPELPVIVLDHVIPAADEKTATGHKLIRDFVERYRIPHFFDIGTGTCHQVMVEQGFARPGRLVLGSDSHTCMYGALGCFATGIDRTEAAALLLTGETWLKVPTTIRIELRNQLPLMVSAKDLILTVIGQIGADGANYRAVEMHGQVSTIGLEERLTIANMGIEMGAKILVLLVDQVVRDYRERLGIA